MKGSKVLYHGSDKRIKLLKPMLPYFDLPENSMNAVFATDIKDVAIMMGMSNQKGAISFANRDTIILNFVRSYPKMKYVYLHYLKSNNFQKHLGHEFISYLNIRPFKIERYKVSKLNHLWRKSNRKELKDYLKDRNTWRVPKR